MHGTNPTREETKVGGSSGDNTNKRSTRWGHGMTGQIGGRKLKYTK